MAMNSQQFGPRYVVGVKEAVEVSSPMQQQLNELTAFVRKLVVGFAPRRAYDPYLNTFNSGCRDHPNFSYGNQQSYGQQQPPGFKSYGQQQPQMTMPQASMLGNSLYDMVKSIESNFLQFQQGTRTSIKNLEDQMSQVVNEVRDIKKREKGKLPARTHMNTSNVSSMVLLSGKDLEGLKVVTQKEKAEEEIEKEIEQEANKSTDQVNSKPHIQSTSNIAPFPYRLMKPAKSDKDKEIIEMFKKVELSIPLLDAIKQVPCFAKFLKELCTKKKKLRGDENVLAGEIVSAVLQRKLPQRCGDPSMFVVPCKIGKMEIRRAMLDLGAAINVMPKSIFNSLNIGPLKETGIVIQLADRTNAHPEGIIEDVLVQVNELIFPVDFYVLDMHDENSPNPSPILLGRPFMCTAHTKIDVRTGTLTMEFEGVMKVFEVGEIRKLQLQEFEEIHNKAFENARINKGNSKEFHDPNILRKDFNVGQKVLLYPYRLKLFPGKLRSRWIGPFFITNMFPYGAIEIQSLSTKKRFVVNGHRLKPYYEGYQSKEVECVALFEPCD
ncbi:uncharacterized protein LOC127255175 [Andrographis paniculata]|uniref:uncharacterized protein LOC127255175 n=1 Tax=Andrographis paniculata TaxID=175694 RepID=UPI0021E88233|nr:uncharacterized protein LOC127255175 [Andrographis paniculata]